MRARRRHDARAGMESADLYGRLADAVLEGRFERIVRIPG